MIHKKIIFLFFILFSWSFCYCQKTESSVIGKYAVALNFDKFNTIGYLHLYSDSTYTYENISGKVESNCDSTLCFFCNKTGSFSLGNNMIDFNPKKKDRTYYEILRSKFEFYLNNTGQWIIRDGTSRSFPAYTIVKAK
jgi:hypothetical protein